MSATKPRKETTMSTVEQFSAPIENTFHAPAQPMSQAIGEIMLNDQLLAQALKMAEMMAGAKVTVPKHLQDNVGDCYAIVLQSLQWKVNPFVVAQKTHTVNETLGYEAQLVNALINAMAPTKDRINYDWVGPWEEFLQAGMPKEMESKVGITCWATLKGESEPRRLPVFYLSSVTTRNSPNWKNDPRQQMAYLAVKRWSRLHCPDVILGVYTPDELESSPGEPRDITPPRSADDLPEYPEDRFAENLPKWRDLIESGRKSAREVITMVESRARLSESQREAILNLEAEDAQ